MHDGRQGGDAGRLARAFAAEPFRQRREGRRLVCGECAAAEDRQLHLAAVDDARPEASPR